MSDGASKAVADSTGYAVYFGPMSEAKQNHAAMLQLLEPFKPDHFVQVIRAVICIITYIQASAPTA